jgi:hypothetical protein
MAVCALVSAPVYAGTALANDPPSVSLTPGSNAPDAFKLADFFADPTGAQVDAGGSLVGEYVTIDGAAASAEDHTQISAGSENGSADILVSVDKFGNRPAIDNNNRLVGVPGGNAFVNLIPAGGSVTSLPLGNPGGGGTPGGGTPGGGALTTAIGEVSLSMEGTWRGRSSGPAAGTGITAAVDAAGVYTISAAAGASPSIVSIVSPGADVVQVLAAEAVASSGDLVGVHTAGPGANVLVIGTTPVSVGEYAQLQFDYNASAVDGVAIAVIGFDGAVAFQSVSYSNPSGGSLEAGVTKTLATSIKSTSGSVIPALQIFNGGTAQITVTVSNAVVGQARPLVDYAIDPNHTAYANDLSSTAGLIGDILQQGAAGPTQGNGFIVLDGSTGTDGVANASIQAVNNQGTNTAEVFVQRVGDAPAGSFFVLNVTDGGPTSYAAFVPGSAIPTDGFLKVQATGTVQADGTAVFVTLQSVNVTVNCMDLTGRDIMQADNQYDANLL